MRHLLSTHNKFKLSKRKIQWVSSPKNQDQKEIEEITKMV